MNGRITTNSFQNGQNVFLSTGDRGATWSTAPIPAPYNVDTAFWNAIVLPNGHFVDLWEDSTTHHSVRTWNGTTLVVGATLEANLPATEPPHHAGSGKLTRVGSGRLLWSAGVDGSTPETAATQGVNIFYSDDEGATWQRSAMNVSTVARPGNT